MAIRYKALMVVSKQDDIVITVDEHMEEYEVVVENTDVSPGIGKWYNVEIWDSTSGSLVGKFYPSKVAIVPAVNPSILNSIKSKVVVPLLCSIQDKDLREVTADNVLAGGIFDWPSSANHHRMIERVAGGLFIHTATVAYIAAKHLSLPIFQGINQDVVLTAAFWHDMGKMHCYSPNDKIPGFFSYNKHTYKKFGHILLSQNEFLRAIVERNIDESLVEEIAHCILASHGILQWGAIVEPQTKEANLVWLSDMLSERCVASDINFMLGSNAVS